MDHTAQKEHKERMCAFCKGSLEGRVKCNNGNSLFPVAFIYMKHDESCHLECYIKECITNFMNKNS